MSQDTFEKDHLITYRLDRARETLKDARLLYGQGGSPESIINRAYYAMFYAILAILITLGMGASKHSGVISLFDQQFVKTGKLPIRLSKAIHKGFDLRQIGDYRELMALSQEQAEEILLSADQFVDTVAKYLADT